MIFKRKKIISQKMISERLNSKYFYRNFFLFIMGMMISSIAINIFYYPNDIVTTGTTGVSILVNNYVNIDISLLVLVFSSIFLVLGFAVFGNEYGAKSLLGTIFYPVFLKATSLLTNVVSFSETSLFLIILIGSVLAGIGFGLVRRTGYNMGGFNILYDICYKYFKVSIGRVCFICNIIIIFASFLVFGIDKSVYAGMAIWISSAVADRVVLGISRNKAFYIITRKPNDVIEYIVNNLNHTVTIVNAKGGYSNKKRKILLCVIPTIEYSKVKEVIKEIDNSVFFLITDTYSISKWIVEKCVKVNNSILNYIQKWYNCYWEVMEEL